MTALGETVAKFAKVGRGVVDKTPKQWRYTIAGGGVGAAAAGILGVGAIGVASGLGAFALPGIALVAIPGMIIGNRIGVGLEKRDLKRAAQNAERNVAGAP